MTSKLLSYGTQLCKSEELISKACSSIDEKEGDFNHLSNFIWEHPELGYMEIEAHKILTGYLEKEGFNVSKNFVVETGFRAQYVHSDGPNIAVFCEYDALPSIGHACGHNLIAVAGIAAAVGIKDALQKSKIKGKITVYGTPAEEGLGGKIDFIEENAFQNIDAALMVHPCSFNAVKPGILTRMNADVTFTGQGSHAGGAPWEGVNAMDAAVLAYQGISTMRQQIRTDCRFHVLISHSEDAKLNIIPSKAYMKVGTRAPDLVALGTMKHKLVSILEGAALMTGCSLEK